MSGALQVSPVEAQVRVREAIYQRASGDNAVTQAWINALLQPGAAASNRSQTLARIGVSTRF
ncbi:hypothetical protein [Paraburkholderia diazotrophica]|uniref:hypothetical protein n=1 Tax=Paraburkholderia diazotrophica TaxID=667676 RepID=UPI003171AE9F